MPPVSTNLYRLDDVLIRAGFIFGAIALIGGVQLTQQATLFSVPFWALMLLPLFALAPIAMLGFGYAVRRRERRLIGIWKVVKTHREMSVNDLMSMTGFRREELKKAVGFLNRKAVAGLSWDEAADVVRCASMGPISTLTHSQRCGSCGASVNVEVSARSRADSLGCPYCKGALDSDAITELKKELMRREARQRGLPEPQTFSSTPLPRRGKPFNWVIFIVLMMMFWPAGVFYAIRYGNSVRHIEEILDLD